MTISLIIPTRQRLEKLTRMIKSVIKNAADPAGIEIILVIDQDDQTYVNFAIKNAQLTTVITPPGLTMGQLNMAGYNACTGDYIMLMNDDVVASTPNWDQIVLGVFRDHPDGVLLVHVNDKIFGGVLCTFPFVTRKFCDLAGGICLSGYRRYRIDDHIYSVFNLLSVLGHNRIVYLENVVFEHLNTVTDEQGIVSYQPDPHIHKLDTALFDESLEVRKSLAIDLAETIQAYKFRNNRLRRAQILAPVTDTVALRRPEFVRFDYENLAARQAARVTVCVVTADLRSAHAKRCLELLKLYTSNYDLVILDNNRGPNFNHPREMNQLIETCRTNYLVLLDDDIFVEPGWLAGMLAACGPGVGVVTPLHKSADGNLSYAGIVMNPDQSGAHSHALAVHPDTFPIQTLCSAAMLIDIVKCGDLRVDESYSKYFLDLDFGLRVWEHGYQVVCTPHVGVTHVGGGTLAYGTELSSSLYEEQRLHFVREWIATGRYAALARSAVWRDMPEIRTILDFPARIMDLVEGMTRRDAAAAIHAVESLLDALHPYPALEYWMTGQVYKRLGTHAPDFAVDETRTLALLAGQFDYPIPVQQAVDGGEKIYLWFGRYYEVPAAHFNRDTARAGLYKSAARIEYLASAAAPAAISPAATPGDPETGLKAAGPVLCEAGYKGFNIIRCGSVFAISQAEGAFQFDRAQHGDYPVMFRGETVADVRAQIDQLEPVLLEEGYRGFNLVQFDRCYALPQAEGAFDIARIGYYKPLFEAPDPAGLRRAVDAFLAGIAAASEPAVQEPEAPPLEQVLCEEGVRGFNIIQCGSVFAIPQAAGAFDIDRAQRGGYPVMFRGETVAEVRAQINGLEPVLLEEGYRGFNLVQFDRCYALPQTEGAFDISQAGHYKTLFEALDVAELRRAVDAFHAGFAAASEDVRREPEAPESEALAEPVLCAEGVRGFNLLRCGDVFYGLPQYEGAFDRVRAEVGDYPVLISGTSLAGVKGQIEQLEPVLLEEGYRGFNFVQFDRVYGLPQADGAFQIERALEGAYAELYQGADLAAVKRSIDSRGPARRLKTRLNPRLSRSAGGATRAPVQADPARIAEDTVEGGADSRRWLALNPVSLAVVDYKGWNIYRFEFKYFGIPVTDGAFDYDSFRHGGYPRCALGHTITEVQQQLDRLEQPAGTGSRLIMAAFAGPEAAQFVQSAAPAAQDRVLVQPDQAIAVPAEARIFMTTQDRWAYLRHLQDDPGTARFGMAVLPWLSDAAWQDNGPEQIAMQMSDAVEIMTKNGERRVYRGENLHRLMYNKAYLCSMLEVVPLTAEMRVLEVGCSDGLVCDMLRLRGARDVTGTDIMTTAGCAFLAGDGLTFASRDARDLGFADESFDMVYSIATMEHLPFPAESFEEMIRVLRIGGYGYVQAGPLYYSPFGHHMFGYLDALPWAHLRMAPGEIMVYLNEQKSSEQIASNFGIDLESYVTQMLTRDHLNHLRLDEYGLDGLRADPRLEILKFNISREGEGLLTEPILAEIQARHPGINETMLIQHGFEIAFRRRA